MLSTMPTAATKTITLLVKNKHTHRIFIILFHFCCYYFCAVQGDQHRYCAISGMCSFVCVRAFEVNIAIARYFRILNDVSNDWLFDNCSILIESVSSVMFFFCF